MAEFKDDFTIPEGRENGISGILVPGDGGYLRAVFTDVTREEIKKSFGQIIKNTLDEYKPIDARRESNLRAFEATSGSGEAITIPTIKRDANQQLAWLINEILSKDPPFTVRALDNDMIEVLVDEGAGPQIVQIAADEYAEQLTALVNFYLLHKIGFKKTLRTWIAEMLRDGNRPPILKVIYEEREKEAGRVGEIVLGKDGKIERIEKDPVFRKVKDGEPARIEGVSGDQFYVPVPWDDIQRAPFALQKFHEDTATVKDKIARGVYDFCRAKPDQNDIDMVLTGAKSVEDVEKWRADGRRPIDPLKEHKLYELWFDYPFAEFVPGAEEVPPAIDPATGQPTGEGTPATEDTVTVRMVPFCAVIHAETGIWLNCYENFRWDRKRPFFAGRMQDRPFSFAGYSITENCAPFQKLITQLFNAQLQNIAVSNVATVGVREGSPAWNFFKKNGMKVRPGMVWPFREPNDVSMEPLGKPVGSMAPEIAFLNSESENMSMVRSFDRGEVPGRTPVGTFDATQQLSKVQPRMHLDNIRDTLSDVVECFVRTLAQFNPGGVRVPFRDPVTSDGKEVRTVGFPVEWQEGIFVFDITATGDEETPQALTMRDIMLSGEISKFNGEILGVASAAFMPGTPPPIMALGMRLIASRRNMLANVIKHNRLNPDEYLPPQKQIEMLPVELLQLQMMAQQAAMMNGQMPMGGPMEGEANVLPPEGGGGLPEGDGGAAPTGVVEGEPDDGGAPVGDQPQDLPAQL